MKCVRCGCTDKNACPGGCSWVSHNPPICSRCIPGGQLVEKLDRELLRAERFELTAIGRLAIDPDEPA